MKPQAVASALEFLLPLALLCIWWFWSAESGSFYFPPLRDILETFRDEWLSARMTRDLLPSLVRLLCGYGLAALVGIGLGVLLGLSRTASGLSSAVLDFLRSMPAVALIPFAILLFGIGAGMKIFVIAFGSVWPVLLNTIDGVRGTDSQVLDMARSFRIHRRDLLFQIVLPAASPQIFSGLRASLSISIVMMVVSEMLASTDGVGFAILQAQRSFAIKEMWAGIVLLGLIGYGLNLLFVVVERRAMRWYLAMRVSPAKR